MIIDEEDYVAHFGVKGMKWGQRKSTKTKKPPRPDSFAAQSPEIQKKIVATIGGTVVFGSGLAATAIILRRKGHIKWLDAVSDFYNGK